MVAAPPLPSSAPSLPVQTVTDAANEFSTMLQKLTNAQCHAAQRWLVSHPVPSTDPVELAIAATTALTDEELLVFIDTLRATMSRDLWQLLIEE